MLKALANISPSQLMDGRLFDFGSLAAATADLAGELDAAISSHSDHEDLTLVPVAATVPD
jgi:hypothetical protein